MTNASFTNSQRDDTAGRITSDESMFQGTIFLTNYLSLVAGIDNIIKLGTSFKFKMNVQINIQ